MSEAFASAKVIRSLKDELEEAHDEIHELRKARTLMRMELSRVAVDLREAVADVKSKQRRIDVLMAELRK